MKNHARWYLSKEPIPNLKIYSETDNNDRDCPFVMSVQNNAKHLVLLLQK